MIENGKEIIMPAIPTNDNKDNLIRCSWKNFSVRDKALLRARPITKQSLFRAFKERKPSNDANDIMKHVKWAQVHGTGL